MKRHHNAADGILLMLGASLAFSLMVAATKFISKTLSVGEIIFVRSFFGLIAIAFLIHKGRVSWIGKEPKILIARGIVGFISLALYFWCISQIDLGTAVMLNYTGPIFAVIIAHLLFREKTTMIVKAAVAFAFVGVYLLTAPQLHVNLVPLLVGLLSGVLLGMVHVLIRYSHEEEDSLTIIFYFMVTATIGSGLMLFRSGLHMPSSYDWLGLAVLVVTSIFGQLAITYSLRTAPVSVVSPFSYITPVISVFLGWWIWREALPTMSLVGSGLIILCGMIMYKYQT